MTPRDKAIVGGLITLVCVGSIPLLLILSPKTPATTDAPDSQSVATATPSPRPDDVATPALADAGPPRAVVSALPRGASAAAQGRPVLALGSPREVVETQRRLLEGRDDDAFRSTFMPDVQSELTAEAIESCRKRLAAKTVKPDWEVAEESMERGEAGIHTVVRVSMFGKSMTGFHEVAAGRWLADAAWCVPVF